MKREVHYKPMESINNIEKNDNNIYINSIAMVYSPDCRQINWRC